MPNVLWPKTSTASHLAMPFLSRRSVDPLTPVPRDKAYARKSSDLAHTSRNRARSEASLLRRVSSLFTGRRQSPSTRKTSLSQITNASPVGIGYICHTLPRRSNALSRISSDSTTSQSSLEIRRPSGLGRRASLLESNRSTTDSDSFGEGVNERAHTRDRVPAGYASLPNLLGGTFYAPEREYSHPVLLPARRTAPNLPLPDPLFQAVLECLPRNDLAVVALVSRGFCDAARHALYHSLDVQTMRVSSLEMLFNVLADSKELAALVVSFCCHSWPSSSWEPASLDALVSPVPSDDVRQAFQNMYNLKFLTVPSFASILSHTSSLVFSLTDLTILDKKISQSQLQALCSWLSTQPTLESLSFPHLVEYTTIAHPSYIGARASIADLSQANGLSPFITPLPRLKSLRASTEIVSALRFAINNPIQHLTLDVRETLFTGLRPSSVIRSLNGVREMHVIFGPEVDKRTVEKFLGVTGSILTGENKLAAMKSLEVEVMWTDEDAAETLYGIVTAIISRFRGLETLKLTSPFRSIQAPLPNRVSLSLLGSPNSILSPPRSPMFSSAHLSTPPRRCSMMLKEFVACNLEQSYARTWTKHCPSLSDIRFDFSCSAADADLDVDMGVDVELCGMWFRRKITAGIHSSLPMPLAT